MCEPLSILATSASLFAASLKLSHSLILLRSRFQRVPETVSSLLNEMQLTSLGLGELESLLRSRHDVLASASRDDAVRQHMLQCVEAVTVSMAKSFSLLDGELGKLVREGEEERRGVSWRLKFMWVESDLDAIMAQVRDQRSSLVFLMQLVSTSKIDDIHRHFKSTSPGLAALRRTATVAKDSRRATVKPKDPIPSSDSVAPELQKILQQDANFPDLEDIHSPTPEPKPATSPPPVIPNPSSPNPSPPYRSPSQPPHPSPSSQPPIPPTSSPRRFTPWPATPYHPSTLIPATQAHHELHYAVTANDLGRIPSLLSSNHSPLSLPLDPSRTLPNASKTPLSLAAYLAREPILRLFLESYSWALNECVGSDLPPLHAAAFAGHVGIVKLLLAAGANPRLRGVGNCTPLLWASARGHREVVEVLLAAGAAEGDVNLKNDRGLTPCIVAAQHGHADVVRVLLGHGADVGATNAKGQAALHLASHAGRLETVEILLAAGAGINTPTDNGKTPLIFAAAAGKTDVVELLAAGGALVNVVDGEAKTALYHACSAGHAPTVEVLLDRLAVTETNTRDSDRPLHVACERGHARVVGYLLDAGARMDVRRGKDGLDALGVAVWYRRKEVLGPLVLYRVERDPGYGLLRALWNAVEWELEEAVDALLESGAEVDGVEAEEDGSGQTLLARAVREGKEAAVRLLLDKGADVNRLDRFGASPLHRAARSAEVDIARVLVAAGARLDAVDRTGRTPRQVAEVYGDEAMRQFFAACVDPE